MISKEYFYWRTFNFTVTVLSIRWKPIVFSFSFRIGRKNVSRIVTETCKAVYLLLKDIYLKSLETPEQWENIYSKFKEVCNFLMCSEQFMTSISELKVQEILGLFITIIKDFSVWFYWQFVCKRFERGTFSLPEPKFSTPVLPFLWRNIHLILLWLLQQYPGKRSLENDAFIFIDIEEPV